jgi:hypothetical protein
VRLSGVKRNQPGFLFHGYSITTLTFLSFAYLIVAQGWVCCSSSLVSGAATSVGVAHDAMALREVALGRHLSIANTEGPEGLVSRRVEDHSGGGAMLADYGMGLGISTNAIAMMKLQWPVLLEHLDQSLFLLLVHPVKGAGEADAHDLEAR